MVTLRELSFSGKLKDARVIVTGASGFLGSWVCKRLHRAGALVWGIDKWDGMCRYAIAIDKDVPLIKKDIRDTHSVLDILKEEKIEYCFHLAGQASIEYAGQEHIKTFESNIDATWNFLEACRRAGTIQSIVCASSNHIYRQHTTFPVSEDAPLNQLDVYGASKGCADMIARCFAHNFDLPVVVIRNVNTFGPGDPHISHIVPGTVIALLKDQQPIIRSDGSPTKAYLHVQDTVEAYILAALNATREGIKGEAFNVTSSHPIRVLDLVQNIIRISGKTNFEPLVMCSDISQKNYFEHLSGEKMRKRLGWEAKVTLEEGLNDTYNWYANHGIDWINDILDKNST